MGHPREILDRHPFAQKIGKGWAIQRESKWQNWFSITVRDGANRAWPACFFALAAASSAVNGKPFDVYFVTEAQRIMAKSSLVLTETAGSFNVICTADGGGVNGQAGAVRMGVARALQEFNPELRAKLKAEGFLRRDARGKERKKYGQKGARKRFQFSKR